VRKATKVILTEAEEYQGHSDSWGLSESIQFRGGDQRPSDIRQRPELSQKGKDARIQLFATVRTALWFRAIYLTDIRY
jgi:hypothetical protein